MVCSPLDGVPLEELGDTGSADAEFDLFQRVTPADIQRAAQTYFAHTRRIVITVTPKAAKGDVK